MPASKTSKHVGALRVSLLLADDIRVEVGGKLTAVGIYTDHTLIASIERSEFEAASAENKRKAIAVGNLSAAFTIGGLSKGRHKVAIFYFDPSMGQPKGIPVRETVAVVDGPHQAFNLIGRFGPFVTAGFGTKTFELEIDGETRTFNFSILSAEHKSTPVEFVDSSSAAKAKAKETPVRSVTRNGNGGKAAAVKKTRTKR
jgi:hypothetical protein